MFMYHIIMYHNGKRFLPFTFETKSRSIRRLIEKKLSRLVGTSMQPKLLLL